MRNSTAKTLEEFAKLDTNDASLQPTYPGETRVVHNATGKRRGKTMNTTVSPTSISPGAGGNVAHNNATNSDGRYQDLLDKTAQLGAIAGQGEDVQIKHLLMVTQAAYEGVISLVDKGPNTPDDAEVITKRYWEARNKGVVFSAKAPNQRKTISCIRSCIALGAWDKGGPGELMGMINKAMSNYQRLRKDPTQSKRLIDAANYLVGIARKMKRSDDILPDDLLVEMMFKKESEHATVEDVLDSLRKTLQKLHDGKHPAGVCNTANIDNARKLINRELKAMADGRKAAETAEALATAAADITGAADQQAKQAGVAAPVTAE